MNVIDEQEKIRCDRIREGMKQNRIWFGAISPTYEDIDRICRRMVNMMSFYYGRTGVTEFNVFLAHEFNALNHFMFSNYQQIIFKDTMVPDKYTINFSCLPARGEQEVEVVPCVDWDFWIGG